MRATYRLRDLLNAGEFALMRSGRRSQDGYGRGLRLVVRAGKSLGGQLVGDGLAHPWRGAKEPWC
jgi:micrococcal nuclease